MGLCDVDNGILLLTLYLFIMPYILRLMGTLPPTC
jgi:hypothetical protein